MKSKMTKLAAAAVIIVAVVIGIDQLGSIDGASVAWGQVAQRVEKIPTVTYHRTVVHPQGGLAAATFKGIVYLSGQTARVDSFPMGAVNPRFCWLSIGKPPLGLRVHEYDANTEAPYRGAPVYLEGDPNKPSSDPGMGLDEYVERWTRNSNYDLEEYQAEGYRGEVFFLEDRTYFFSGGRHQRHQRRLSEEEADRWYRNMDPREWVKEALSLDYKKLGRANIEGIEVEGIEVVGRDLAIAPYWKPDRDVIIRFWVDVKTGLPVRYEARKRHSRWHGDFAMVVDEIHWNQEI
ncbi:MAG: hypothetical protein ACYSWP_20815 [Planctomycetota bacterium]